MAFVAGAILEGQSNGIAHALPTCYGSPSDCGCPAVCPKLTDAERVGSNNVVNVRVRTGTPVCSGDCSRNALNWLNTSLGFTVAETQHPVSRHGRAHKMFSSD